MASCCAPQASPPSTALPCLFCCSVTWNAIWLWQTCSSSFTAANFTPTGVLYVSSANSCSLAYFCGRTQRSQFSLSYKESCERSCWGYVTSWFSFLITRVQKQLTAHVRDLKKKRKSPWLIGLYHPNEHETQAELLLTGADDCASLTAVAHALRARRSNGRQRWPEACGNNYNNNMWEATRKKARSRAEEPAGRHVSQNNTLGCVSRLRFDVLTFFTAARSPQKPRRAADRAVCVFIFIL